MIVDRWQEWLAVEHEAIWTYSTLAARHQQLREPGRAAETAHRETRDQLARRIRIAGAEPVGTLASYGANTASVRRSRQTARDIEGRIASVCLRAVGESEGKDRRFSSAGLSRAALASLDWQGAPTTFPGA